MADTLPPLSLYLHFPWCVAKCPYCDFNSHSLRGELPASAYVDVLIGELRALPTEIGERPLVSIFLGGGTPSLFPAQQLERLLRSAEERFCFAADIEITLEANPGALERGSFRGYRAAGVNRLSLGVQSFADEALRRLGRIHDSNEVVAAFRAARSAGFDNINLDLMYALPGQTVRRAVDDVRYALRLEPEHVSHYHLTLEPNTMFHAQPPRDLPDADLAWDIQAECADALEHAGYENYEVSAWGRPGRAGRHNLNYWNFGDYVGLGAGAHGKSTQQSAHGTEVRRYVRVANPREYMRRAPAGTAVKMTTLTPDDLAFEFMLNGLRLREGVPVEQFTAYTGVPVERIALTVREAERRGLMESPDGGRFRATALGRRFLDDLQALFLPDGPDATRSG